MNPIMFKHSSVISLSSKPTTEETAAKIEKLAENRGSVLSYCSFLQALTQLSKGEEIIVSEESTNSTSAHIKNLNELIQMSKKAEQKVIVANNS